MKISKLFLGLLLLGFLSCDVYGMERKRPTDPEEAADQASIIDLGDGGDEEQLWTDVQEEPAAKRQETTIYEQSEKLLKAAATEDQRAVAELLQDPNVSSFINMPDPKGKTPLYIASEKGYDEIVLMLLKSGAETTRQTISCCTALHVASKNGHIKVVENLIQNGANIDRLNSHSETALYAASKNGHTEIVKLLLSHSADATRPRKNHSIKITPLEIAKKNSHTEIVKLLEEVLSKQAAASSSSTTTDSRISEEQPEDVQEMSAFTAASSQTATETTQIKQSEKLLKATATGDQRAVAELLQDPNVSSFINIPGPQRKTPLYIASENGYDEIVLILLKCCASTTKKATSGHTALHIASANGHIKVVKYLIQNGANIDRVNSPSKTALYIASKNGHTEIVRLLLSHGADATKSAKYQGTRITPLEIAERNNRTEIVTLLEEALLKQAAASSSSTTTDSKISEEQPEDGQETSAFTAASSQTVTETTQIEQPEKLLEVAATERKCVNPEEAANQANLGDGCDEELSQTYDQEQPPAKRQETIEDASMYFYENPLSRAIEQGNAGGVDQFSLRAYCNKEEDEWTPLCLAAMERSSTFIECLINAGADVNLAGQNGISPLQIAVENGNIKIVEILLSAGARIPTENVEVIQTLKAWGLVK